MYFRRNWFVLIVLSTAWLVACDGDGEQAAPDGPGEFQADYATSSEFFTLMTEAKEGYSPHGIQQTWYSSNIKELIEQESFTVPEGTVTIKEFDMDKDGALDGLAVMIKRAPGFDADNGDWYYDMRSLDGQVLAEPSPGANPLCIGCHEDYAATDYLGATRVR